MTEHASSYYAASTDQREPFPALSEPVSHDVCIAGGDYTGLSSAPYLVKMGYDVVLLESVHIGFGASGHDGGQLVNSYSCDINATECTCDPDAAKVFGGMMFEDDNIIHERIKRYQIGCNYCSGGLFAALNHKQMGTLEEQKSSWECYGNTQLELLDSSEIRREVSSEHYVGAPLDHSGGHTHLLSLVIGETSVIRLDGGRVSEQSPVTRTQYISSAVVSTEKGQVMARFAIVASSAYLSDKLEPTLVKSSMPCGTQVLVAEPLSAEMARSLTPKNYCMKDCNYPLDYYRLTGDNRLLYGGGVVHGACDPDDIECLAVPKLLKTFPQLQGARTDYHWTGNPLLMPPCMPRSDRPGTNICYMQGYSSHGVTCTHLVKRPTSELLRGDVEYFDAFAKLPYCPFPGGHSLRIPFTAMGVAYYSLRDCLGV